MKEVYAFLKKCERVYLGNCYGDQPRALVFGVAVFEDKLYIEIGYFKKISAELRSNPKLEICGHIDGDEWLYIEATAVEDERLEAKRHMLDEYPSLKRMYAADDGNTEVFWLKDATATFSSFTAEPRTVKF